MKATTKARKKRSMRMIVSDTDFHSGNRYILVILS